MISGRGGEISRGLGGLVFGLLVGSGTGRGPGSCWRVVVVVDSMNEGEFLELTRNKRESEYH